MNILFLNTDTSDYGQDILFAGLRNRSDIHLYEYPFNKRFHFPVKPYPRNLGYEFNGLWKALLTPVPWNDLDVCVVANCNPRVLDVLEKVLPRLSAQTKLVFVDGGDWEEIGGDFQRLGGYDRFMELRRKRDFDLIFKREKIIGKDYPANTIAFPFGFNLKRVPAQLPSQKKYDVSFWAVESDPIRTKVLGMLQDKYDCRSNGTMLKQNFSKYKRKGSFYLQELAACKIVLNFRGAGWDTLRYWEAPAVGAFMISQPPKIEIPDNFRPGTDVVFCNDDASDLLALCDYYLEHDREREQIAANGKAWLEKFHSASVRAQYFLDHLRKR